MTRTTPELARPSPSFRAAPTGGRLATTYDLACNRPHTRRIFSGIGFRGPETLLKSQPLVRHRRQVYQTDLQPGATYPNRTVVIQQSQRVPEFGPWGPWTESSHCSRSCGGGIAYQDRICLDA
ncbi:hypothetical protein AVEN_106957-1, partial [Araneus ventricosus]